MRDGNRVQDSCNRLNWGAPTSAPQLSLLQLPRVPSVLVNYITVTHKSHTQVAQSLLRVVWLSLRKASGKELAGQSILRVVSRVQPLLI